MWYEFREGVWPQSLHTMAMPITNHTVGSPLLTITVLCTSVGPLTTFKVYQTPLICIDRMWYEFQEGGWPQSLHTTAMPITNPTVGSPLLTITVLCTSVGPLTTYKAYQTPLICIDRIWYEFQKGGWYQLLHTTAMPITNPTVGSPLLTITVLGTSLWNITLMLWQGTLIHYILM
jgi:hypothetical protein